MSEANAPYYYNKNSDTYHWETSCSKNHYSTSDPNWVKTSSVPTGKEQCNECKSKRSPQDKRGRLLSKPSPFCVRIRSLECDVVVNGVFLVDVFRLECKAVRRNLGIAAQRHPDAEHAAEG